MAFASTAAASCSFLNFVAFVSCSIIGASLAFTESHSTCCVASCSSPSSPATVVLSRRARFAML